MVSLAYYLRVVAAMWMPPTCRHATGVRAGDGRRLARGRRRPGRAGQAEVVAVALLGAATIFFGIVPARCSTSPDAALAAPCLSPASGVRAPSTPRRGSARVGPLAEARYTRCGWASTSWPDRSSAHGPAGPILDVGASPRSRRGSGSRRDPHPAAAQSVVLAKQLASVDVVSGGRLVFGMGVGYLEPEMTAIGVPMERRGTRAVEYLQAMRALWEQEQPSFEGEFARFSGVNAHPRPVQRPLPW